MFYTVNEVFPVSFFCFISAMYNEQNEISGILESRTFLNTWMHGKFSIELHFTKNESFALRIYPVNVTKS